MADAPLHKCNRAGCMELVRTSYCKAHKTQAWREASVSRETSNARGYNYRWQKFRAWYLVHRTDGMCAHCKAQGHLTPAEHLDHITPHNGDQRLMWDESNLQPLCLPCHSRKTIAETNINVQ